MPTKKPTKPQTPPAAPGPTPEDQLRQALALQRDVLKALRRTLTRLAADIDSVVGE